MTHTNNKYLTPSFSTIINELIDSTNIREEFMGKNGQGSRVATNIEKTEDKYILQLMAPGFEKTDFKITLEKNALVVTGKLPTQDATSEATKSVKTEFKIQNFERSFKVTDAIDTEKIAANYENGILEITLYKKEPSRADTINITVQ